MKQIILMFFALMVTFAATESFAADKNLKKEIKTVEFLTDLHCENCAKKIMDFLPTQKGIKDVKIDLPTKMVKVSYDSRKTTTSKVIELLGKIDVHAKVVDTAKLAPAK